VSQGLESDQGNWQDQGNDGSPGRLTVEEDRKARINRLKWHCRRALLELDLVFDRFWERYEDTLDVQGEAALESLLELEDHDLWALVSGREVTDDPQQASMIKRLREVSPIANFEELQHRN
jgi:succinate dehydrogenase flavin-adding protein (antitoxin of CptAB toxin-antitoxin module)